MITGSAERPTFGMCGRVFDRPPSRLPIGDRSPILLRTAERHGLAALGVAATGSRLITGGWSSRKLG